MSAATVLVKHQRHGAFNCKCGAAVAADGGYKDRPTLEQHQLDALKAAGFAVVELPKSTIVPTGWNEDCSSAWPTRDWVKDSGDDPIGVWPNQELSLPDFLDYAHQFISASKARRFAAALLAAADAAEAQS